ncbi:uncharacterized protein ACJ7VT_018938 isoform 1-T1 [Polymixia lowei]
MKILYIDIFFILLAVCVEASMVMEVSGYIGGEVSIQCSIKLTKDSSSNNYNKYFCKGLCSSQDILIQSEGKKSGVIQQGRYSMVDNRGDGAFSVTIKRLEKTDTGRYHCRLERIFNVSDQEVHLKVLDSSAVFPGPFPSNTTLQTMTEPTARENYPSTVGPSPAAVTHPPIEHKTDKPAATSLTGTTVVIIVSVSLAIMVCALIPLIFYGRWRSNKDSSGLDTDKGSKIEAGYSEDNEEQDVTPTQHTMGL